MIITRPPRHYLQLYLAALALSCIALSATAQTDIWQPQRSMTLIAPAKPGGGWDQTARFMQLTLAQEQLLDVPLEVINRGGAGGTIGLAELVERHPADPHKLLVSGFGMNGAVLLHNSPHSLLSSTPIARLTSEYQVFAVPVESPYQKLSDLLQDFQQNPKAMSWGGGSAGGADHIFINLVGEQLGISPDQISYVAFAGGGEASAALLGGQVNVGIGGYAEWQGLLEAGRVRLLAISAQDRSANANLPTFRELGLDIVFANWRCLLAAPGITPAQRQWLTDTITQAVASETWQQILKRNQWQDSFLTGDAFEAFIAEDAQTTVRILKRMGLGSDGSGYAIIGPYFFPWIIAAGLLLCGLLLTITQWRQTTAPATNTETTSNSPWPKFLSAFALCVAYAWLLDSVGFIWITPLFVLLMAKLMGSYRWVRDSLVGVGLTAAVFVVFSQFLNMSVP